MRRCLALVLHRALPELAAAQARSAFVGTWRLVAFYSTDSTGRSRPYWDEHPLGQLVYTADGHMSAQLYDARRPLLHASIDSLTAETIRPQYLGSATYYGTYTVDSSVHQVTHLVQGAWQPDWIGRRLTRDYRFTSPDDLELRVDDLVLMWHRDRN